MIEMTDGTMIEVVLVETGDRAYATTAENAVYAARMLARDGSLAYGYRPSAAFYVDGKLVGTRRVAEIL